LTEQAQLNPRKSNITQSTAIITLDALMTA
jgi:hypothetical protein